MFVGLFLIGLILLQRGRGGGLAGAFGGMGGQSAFGTKAGDVFTRITICVAAAWILLCAGSVVALHNSSGGLITVEGDPAKIMAEKNAKEKLRTEENRNGADPVDSDLALDPADDANPPFKQAPPLDTTKPEVKVEEKPVEEPAEKPAEKPAEAKADPAAEKSESAPAADPKPVDATSDEQPK